MKLCCSVFLLLGALLLLLLSSCSEVQAGRNPLSSCLPSKAAAGLRKLSSLRNSAKPSRRVDRNGEAAQSEPGSCESRISAAGNAEEVASSATPSNAHSNLRQFSDSSGDNECISEVSSSASDFIQPQAATPIADAQVAEVNMKISAFKDCLEYIKGALDEFCGWVPAIQRIYQALSQNGWRNMDNFCSPKEYNDLQQYQVSSQKVKMFFRFLSSLGLDQNCHDGLLTLLYNRPQGPEETVAYSNFLGPCQQLVAKFLSGVDSNPADPEIVNAMKLRRVDQVLTEQQLKGIAPEEAFSRLFSQNSDHNGNDLCHQFLSEMNGGNQQQPNNVQDEYGQPEFGGYGRYELQQQQQQFHSGQYGHPQSNGYGW